MFSYFSKGAKRIPGNGGIFPIEVFEGDGFTFLNKTYAEIKAAVERFEYPIIFSKGIGKYFIDNVTGLDEYESEGEVEYFVYTTGDTYVCSIPTIYPSNGSGGPNS